MGPPACQHFIILPYHQVVTLRVRLQPSYNSARQAWVSTVLPGGGGTLQGVDAAPSRYWVPLPIVGMGHLARRKRESQKGERAMKSSSLLRPAHCFLPSLVEDPEKIRGWLEGQDPRALLPHVGFPDDRSLGRVKWPRKAYEKAKSESVQPLVVVVVVAGSRPR